MKTSYSQQLTPFQKGQVKVTHFEIQSKPYFKDIGNYFIIAAMVSGTTDSQGNTCSYLWDVGYKANIEDVTLATCWQVSSTVTHQGRNLPHGQTFTFKPY